MILTRDNLLRFVQQEKAVFPSTVSEAFKTTTLVASAALSELVKQNLVKVTNLKIGSSPYYYDPKQREYLIKIGEEKLSEKYKPFFYRLMEQKIISNSQLSANEQIATSYLQDFAIPLEIEYQDKKFKFWVWYLLDLEDTKNQIINVLNNQSSNQNSNQNSSQSSNNQAQKTNANQSIQSNLKQEIKENQDINKENKEDNLTKKSVQSSNLYTNQNQSQSQNKNTDLNNYEKKTENKENSQNNKSFNNKSSSQTNSSDESDSENYIENYLRENNFKIVNKIKKSQGIHYDLLLENRFNVYFSSFYFFKKFTETELINFYISSLKPKIVFGKKIPKKLEKLAKDLENLYLIDF